jgi:hypothetical protein
MYTPKFSTKRVLGLVMAGALAVSGVVAVAGSSEAAATFTISPKTGPSASTTQIITVTGKGFKSGTTNKVGAVEFGTTCTTTNGGTNVGNNVTNFSVASATTLVVPTVAGVALAASATSTAFLICVYDTASPKVLLGSSKYTVYAAPTLTSVNGATAAAVSGSSLGGDSLTVVGTNFTKASVVRVAGTALKTTYIDSTGLTAITAAHVPVVGSLITVTTEGGSVTAPSAVKMTFLDTIKVTPAFGAVATASVITVTGTGFLLRSFVTGASPAATAVGKSVVVLNLGGQSVSGTGIFGSEGATGSFYCGNVQVQDDSTLVCTVPSISAALVGPYVVQIADGGGTANNVAITAVSRSATYTVSAF